MANQNAILDENKISALTAHSGTAGTSETIRVVADSSGAMMVNIGGTEPIELVAGTIDEVTNIAGGTITVSNPSGTVVEVNDGTLSDVTVTSLPDISGGTIDAITNIAGGTITSLESLPDLPGGTVDLVSSLGALPDLPGGTVDLVSQANVTVGTFSADIPGGTVDLLTNLAGGTIQIDHDPIEPVTTYGTQGTTGAAVRGTLVSAVGAGTDLMVSGLSIIVESGTVDCAICFGTMAGPNGADVLARGVFVPSAGIARDFTIPQSKTNGTLTYYMGGAGTAYFQVNYWDEA